MNRTNYTKLVKAGIVQRMLDCLAVQAAEFNREAPTKLWVDSIAWEDLSDEDGDEPEKAVIIGVSYRLGGMKQHRGFQVGAGQPFGTANDEPLTGEQFTLVMSLVSDEFTTPTVPIAATPVSPFARRSLFSSPFATPEPAMPAIEEKVPSLFKQYPVDGKNGLTINVTGVDTDKCEVSGPLIWKKPRTVVAIVIPYEGLGGNATYTDWGKERTTGLVFPRGELTITVAGIEYKIVQIETITLHFD